MLRRTNRQNTDPSIQQRIEDCDRYHMPFDEAARTFHEYTAEALARGGVPAFEKTFQQLEDATRRELLSDMYARLAPREKLTLMAELIGDTATKAFLQDLAEAQTEYDTTLLTIRAEARASNVLRPSVIPQGAEVNAYFAIRDRVEGLEEGVTLADLTYDRSITMRAIGDGTFKITGEDYADDVTYSDDECFGINDIVRIGAAIRGKNGNKKREKVVRPAEMLAISCGDKTTFLAARADHPHLQEVDDVVVTCIEIDGVQILPPPTLDQASQITP